MTATVDFAGELRAPSKIVCIGRNFADHVSELGNVLPDEMVVFLKPNSAITEILAASHDEALHYEGEICFGVYRGVFRYVGFGLDLTKRGLQAKLKEKGLPWERSKAFDGSAVFSRFVPLSNGFLDLALELSIDGALAQAGSVDQMLFKPEVVLQELTAFCRLEDFDIVMTGTPKGVGPVKTGAVYEGIVRQAGAELVRASWKALP